MEKGPRVLGGLEEQDVVVLLRDVVAERAVAGRDQVGVRVHQTRQDRRVPVVDTGHRRPGWRVDLATPAEGHHAIRFDQEGRVGQGRGALAIEQARGAEQGELGGISCGRCRHASPLDPGVVLRARDRAAT